MGIKTDRRIDIGCGFSPPNAAREISVRRFCFCNFAAAGKVSAWEFPCGNLSR